MTGSSSTRRPGLTDTSEQVLRAADLILVPVIPSPLSQRAFDDVLAFLDRQPDPARTGAAGLQHGRPPPLAAPRRARGACRLAGHPDGERVRGDERHAGRRRPAAARGSPAANGGDGLWSKIEKRLRRVPADEDSRSRTCCCALIRSACFPMSDSRDAPRRLSGSSRGAGRSSRWTASMLSKSLRKTLRSDRFEVTHDRAFARGRAALRRARGHLDQRQDRASYIRLHEAGPRPFGRGLAGRTSWSAVSTASGSAPPSSAKACSRSRTRRLEGRAGLAGRAADRRRLPAARLPVHDRASAPASARSRSTRRTIWRCWRRRSAAARPARGGGSAAGAARRRSAGSVEFDALDRLLGADRRATGVAAAGMGHRAALGPDVVDRVLDDVERRRFLVEPAREDALELALRDCARRAGRRRRSAAAPPRARSSRRRAAARSRRRPAPPGPAAASVRAKCRCAC